MDDAATHLALGQPAPARDSQRRAAELAERGAQSADDLAAALRAEADAVADAKHRPAPDPNANADANPLADARQAMSRAARQLRQAREPDPDSDPHSSAALRDARQAMRGAAERLQAAVEAQDQAEAGDRPGRGEGPRVADADGRDPRGGRAGVAAPAELREIQDMVRETTGRAWGELPGHLRTEILQMSQGRYRDDYARLIQLYFREIAGAAGPAKDARP
jgi:hypothetical protein